MKSMLFAFVTVFAVLALAADAEANCGNCGPKDASAEKSKSAAAGCSAKSCSAETCSAAQCDSSKGCPIAAAMERLPKLSYAVGDKKTCCPKEAATLAEKSGGHIHFVVAGKEFDSKSQAQEALIQATEKLVANFAEPHKCPKSGKLTLAGQAQGCEKTAARTAELMREAMAKVEMTYAVGDQQCACPAKAEKLAKKSGEAKVFVVGDKKTRCEKTGQLNLARAKYKAAVEALVKAQADAETLEPAAGS